MSYNRGLREQLAVVSCTDPDAYAAGTITGDIVDMQKYRRVLYVLMTGDMVSTCTADLTIYGSAASNMSSPGAITGKTITQLTQAGSDDNKQVIVEVTAEDVAAAGYRYIRDSLVLGTAGSDAGVVALGFLAHYSPASEFDLASVDELVPNP